ncbi:hypothetical protein [Sanguibacter suaedae]|uniref:Uncharacterized protein n=1 Tax=Sanguibacter suaedae TaxID=2795737 RepID=A0A934MAS7_9MICO|nr:hypothetical protein [Sanguibacter suaedae]MBI9114551.1 hypothetical protein [Sanguibacter suaedae]
MSPDPARIRAMLLPAVLVGAIALTGCSDQGTQPEPSPTSATADPVPPTETPTSEAPQEGVLVDHTDESVGLVFSDLPDVSGDEADILNTYQQFEHEVWFTNTTASLSETVAEVTTGSVAPFFQERITTLTSGDPAVLGGRTIFSSLTVEAVDGDVALVTSCADRREVTVEFADRTVSALEDGSSPTYVAHTTVLRESGTWKVSGHTITVEDCS